jgi:hypothetical protein
MWARDGSEYGHKKGLNPDLREVVERQGFLRHQREVSGEGALGDEELGVAEERVLRVVDGSVQV